MKNSNKIIITLVLVAAIFLFATFMWGYFKGLNYDPTHTYEAPAVVVHVDDSTGWVTFEDWNGEAWCIRNSGYYVSQLVILTFNDNDTIDIYDDMIVEVRRAEVMEIGE